MEIAYINGVPQVTAGGGDTMEFWVPATRDDLQTLGDFPIVRCNASGEDARMSGKLPHDFTAITNAEIIVIPTATQANANWDITSDYGAEGEAYNANSEADAATTYNVTLNIIYAIDVSGILSAVAANDYIGITVTESTAGHNFDCIGLRIRYS